MKVSLLKNYRSLAKETEKRKNKLPKAPPKYQFEDNGVVKYWSGRGRAPKPIDAALNLVRSLKIFSSRKTSPAPSKHNKFFKAPHLKPGLLFMIKEG